MASELKADNEEEEEEEEELKDNDPDMDSLVLLGDGVLDNFNHQTDKRQHNMAALLRQRFAKRALVTDLSVDGSESRHVLYGITPDQTLVSERQKLQMDPYPVDADTPGLEMLQQLLDSRSLSAPTVVLSVGMAEVKVVAPLELVATRNPLSCRKRP